MKKEISRKKFIRNSLVAGSATLLGLNSCKESTEKKDSVPAIITNKKYKWKMVTTWPPNFPVLGEGCNLFADWVREMSGGRLDIRVYGGGELVPALESFEAVYSGAAEMGSGAAYYWAGLSPATQFFATVPFGMNAQQLNSWIYAGGGYELWQELYDKFNLVPLLAGNTGVQMGGWFNKEINTLNDLKGLKMRMPGLGGKVLEKAGGSAVLSAGSEIYTNLERGVIDATEWIGPYHDYLMGFHQIAKYYYYPGWHEPGTALEFFINKRDFDKIEPDLQSILRAASARLNMWTLSEFDSKNNLYLQKIKKESKVEIRKYPDEVLNALRGYATEVVEEIVEKDEFSRRVYDSYRQFYNNIGDWSELTEKVYYNSLQS
jgi:TRAP-type mannitol/chloroaromatic compound transport system substrate-binding protein